ncbi:hypothetical protein HNE05_09645 [Aquipseudomonas campi]|uniref:Uncharacterized protein n=1 Tax=Aquipseudomonas campi TaxID=2731681 RepID=A0A6M8FHR1_9GAMM|nr:hypothetical protein [Pseudomonas campi]QKE63610.1 hypothetical protein HNE05_09645 [Pseudomonas campi]
MQGLKQGQGKASACAADSVSLEAADLRAASGKLASRRIAVSELDSDTIAQMWSVFCGYYADISRDRFLADLHEKQFVLLLLDSGDRSVQGFTTIQVLQRHFAGKPYLAVYSGDTIINEAYWGQSALQAGFYRFLMGLKARHPLTPLYWFLISKGYKTYLLFSRGCADHWPRYDRPTPDHVLGIIDQLSREKFADDWKPELGLLQFATPAGRLKEGVAPVDDAALAYPDIRYFVERNPGHAQGDELCCLGAINAKTGVSYVGKLARKWVRRQLRNLGA